MKPDNGYMYLKKGDIIKVGDEIMNGSGKWFMPNLSFVIGMAYDPAFMMPHRRLITKEIKDLY